jgi:hypothetical protein
VRSKVLCELLSGESGGGGSKAEQALDECNLTGDVLLG